MELYVDKLQALFSLQRSIILLFQDKLLVISFYEKGYVKVLRNGAR